MKTTLMRAALTTSALSLLGTAAMADQVFLDDVIVDGSLCVGVDCVNGESFGFDTIRLKENNLRIKAQDTSASASFPSNDWQITFNDSSNGGANKFSIDDIDGNRTPFTIEAGAPSHSLYVDDGGRIGLGTSTPVVELHVKDGDSPTLRLEQDGSSGFTAQTWDVAGNETNFFVRDVTNGSDLPFKILPNAGTNALVIEGGTGDIGLGTTSPSNDIDGLGTTAGLHIVNQGGLLLEHTGSEAVRAVAVFKNNGGAIMQLADTSAGGIPWNIQNRGDVGNEFRIVNNTGAGEEFVLTENGNLTITGTLTTSGGTCGGGCDAVFTEEYDLPSISEHTTAMYALGYLPNVGPTIENQPINLSDKVGRMLNELEHAHIYIAELNERMFQLEGELARHN